MTTAESEIIALLQQIKDLTGARSSGPVSWGQIIGSLYDQSDLKGALDAKASVAQAAHTGGIVGTATFDAVEGSVKNLVNDGVISGVGYDSVGIYRVDFTPTQPDANYVVAVSLGGDRSEDIWSHNIPLAEKGAGHFSLEVRFKGTKSDASDNIQVAVMRLSQ